jgi:hypothetical protein
MQPKSLSSRFAVYTDFIANEKNRGSNFAQYMRDNCYFFAPEHLKPLMLGLLENAIQDKGVETSCLAMVNYAKLGMTDSMQPWFDAQFGASQVI